MADALEIEMPGGVILEMPPGSTETAIRAAVANYRASPEFDRQVDKKAGAPARVRTIVGGAPQQDRLRNLRRFYPDATPYGDDNFVFTDPASGRPTLYNPPGLDFGDVPAVAREASQMAGGTLAGAAATAAAPVTGGASLAAVPLAVGAGTAAGGALFDMAMELTGNIETSRTTPQRMIDVGVDFLGGAVGQRGGELISQGAKAIAGAAKPGAQALFEAFSRLGVEAPAGAVSGSRAVTTVEKTLEGAPVSSSMLQRQAERVISQAKTAAQTVANAFGRVQTKQGAGETIRTAAKGAAERFTVRQGKLYDEAFDLVGADTRVSVQSIVTLRDTLKQQLATAPASLKKTLTPAIETLEGVIRDASDGGIPFTALRQIRTNIGRDLDAPVLAGATSSQNSAMKLVYGALSEDMSAAAKTGGPEAAKKLAVADRFTRRFMTQTLPTLEKIAKLDADEKAFGFAMSAAKDGGTRLSKLRRNFTPEEWDTVAGTVLGRMGLAKSGGQDVTQEVFSVNTFLTNWSNLTPEAKEALFGGSRYTALRPALNDLVKVVSSLKETEKLTNFSNTARNMIAFTTLSTLGGAGGFLAGGDPESAAAGVLGTVVAPLAAAKLITSPRFVRWMVDAAKVSPNGFGAHIGRLFGIAQAEPAIREEIGQYVAALRDIPAVEANKTEEK